MTSLTMIEELIPDGWVFLSADFSCKAAGTHSWGNVMLVRNQEGKEKWHSLSEPEQEKVKLHAKGNGSNLHNAVLNAVAQITPDDDIDEVLEESQYYQRGDIFSCRADGNKYILAIVNADEEVRALWSLISLKDGNRWNRPVRFGTYTFEKGLQVSEFDQVFNKGRSHWRKFEKVLDAGSLDV